MVKKVDSNTLRKDISTLISNTESDNTNMNTSQLSIIDITDNPFQPRLDMKPETLLELARSIEDEGQLQPIIVQKHNDKYIVVAGHRRLYAHKIIDKKHIWASIIDEPYSDSIENNKLLFRQATIENIQRDQLTPLELALACKEAIDKGLYDSQNEIANVINKSKSYIAKVMAILKLSEHVIKDLTENKSVKDIESLYELQKITDIEKQENLYSLLKDGEATREDIRLEAKNQKNDINENAISYKKSKYKISLSVNLTKFNENEIVAFETTIEELIKQYSR